METKRANKIFNFANLMTSIRLMIIPFLFFYATNKTILLILFVIAYISDVTDGYLARKFKTESNFGVVYDFITDKLLIVSGLVICEWFYGLGMGWGFLIFLKDLGIIAIRIFTLFSSGMKKINEIKISIIGKSSAVIYLILFISIIFNLYTMLFIILTVILNSLIGLYYLKKFIEFKK